MKKAPSVEILVGDCSEQLSELPAKSVQCCVTSPPYWNLRDYGIEGQLGLEKTPEQYVEKLVAIFREVRRVLRDDGTVWLNLGDSYATPKEGNTQGTGTSGISRPHHKELNKAKFSKKIPLGLKSKDLVGIPWMVAFALRTDGWYLRSEIIWYKPNPMPESVTDRPTKTHEQIFLLTKSQRYFYDAEAIKDQGKSKWKSGDFIPDFDKDISALSETAATSASRNNRDSEIRQGRNKRSVWSVPVAGEKESHFAVFPEKLILPCILAGTSERGCCSVCGAPWVRKLESERKPTRPGSQTKVTGDSLVDGNRDPERHVTETRTVGWEPSCDCGSEEVDPCFVLDPFGGSGTTAATAIKKGRSAIICELNEEYVEIAKRKIKRARSKAGFML